MGENSAGNYGGDPLVARICRCSELLLELNGTPNGEKERRNTLLTQLLGGRGERLCVRSPFYANVGGNIFLGENCFINMNCTFLDDDKITMGDYTLIAPDVKIYTAFHPMTPDARWEEKHIVDGFEFPVTHTAPVTIGAHVWIGGGTIILPGVSIGAGCVVGAGSLVTRDIPAGSVAYGSPCRVVRENI